MAAKSLDGDFIRPERDKFAACPSDSIDYAVMEKSNKVAMVPLDAGWSDIGSWAALQDIRDADDNGNDLRGDVVQHACEGNLVHSQNRLVAAVGLKDTIVVEIADAVLVMAKEIPGEVKKVVAELSASGRRESEVHQQVFRPWASYDRLEEADNFQVKRLIVKPGAVVSLQKHAHRSEHWIVVKGKARVTKNAEEFDLSVNESAYVANGDIQRISNPFDEIELCAFSVLSLNIVHGATSR